MGTLPYAERAFGRRSYLYLVSLFPELRQLGADDLSDVLNHHRVLLNVPRRIEAESLDLGPTEEGEALKAHILERG